MSQAAGSSCPSPDNWLQAAIKYGISLICRHFFSVAIPCLPFVLCDETITSAANRSQDRLFDVLSHFFDRAVLRI